MYCSIYSIIFGLYIILYLITISTPLYWLLINIINIRFYIGLIRNIQLYQCLKQLQNIYFVCSLIQSITLFYIHSLKTNSYLFYINMFFVCFCFVFLLLFFEVVFKFKDVYVRINVYPGFQNLLSDMFTILFFSYLYLTFIY